MEIGLVVVGLGGLGLVLAGVLRYLRLRKQIDHKFYSGKIVFDTLVEYTKFKRAVGNEQVTNFYTNALSSEPPIVVQFGVTAKAEGIFPYGEEKIWHKSDFDMHFIGMFIFGGLFLVTVVVLSVVSVVIA